MNNYRDTSRLAWEQFAPASPTLDQKIIAALKAAGPEGIICEDIEIAIGGKHQAVSGNLRHLAEDGRVEWTGGTGVTSSGRKAMLWALPAPAIAKGTSVSPSAQGAAA